MVKNISKKLVKARKKYLCDFSGKTIHVGETYERQVNVYDGEVYTFRTCERALYLIDKLNMYGRGTYNDGFDDTDYNDMLDDYLAENDLYDEYENYPGRLTDFLYEHLIKKEK